MTRLTYGQVSVLLLGHIAADVERRLVTEGATAGSTVLKAAHHESCNSILGTQVAYGQFVNVHPCLVHHHKKGQTSIIPIFSML